MQSGPIRQIEEAIVLLRRQDAHAWMQYLLGMVPFLLMLLAFQRDMSAGYLASRCAIESLACALSFFWASAWKAKFGGALLATLNGPELAAPAVRFWRAFYLQSIVQTLKLLVLPFAAIAILPLAWTSSFFRNATVEASLAGGSLRQLLAAAARRASVDLRGHWFGVLLLSLISLLVFVNLYILLGLLPILVRTFSGYENLFTRRVESFFTFDIFCIVVALTWLVIDPLVLSYTVVRGFYAEARTDARDLLAKLRVGATLTFFLLAGFEQPAQLSATTLSDQQLSQALKQAAKSDEYGWLRATRDSQSGTENAWLKRLGDDISRLVHVFRSWVSAVGRWLRRLFQQASPAESGAPVAPAKQSVQWLLYGLCAVVLLIAAAVFLRSLKKPDIARVDSPAASEPHDLSGDNILASDLAEEEWLRLAGDLLAKGESRQAVRALYLSNLAYLGSLRFLQIAKAKSNAIYERELRLRPGASGACPPFAQANRSFEQAWYGFHEVTPEFVDLFQQNVEAIRRHAQA